MSGGSSPASSLLLSSGLSGHVVSLVSQTVVAADDPAFSAPTKFVGAIYREVEAFNDEPYAHHWFEKRLG